jgi:hypothetical protein
MSLYTKSQPEEKHERPVYRPKITVQSFKKFY